MSRAASLLGEVVSPQNGLSGILGPLCAEQDVGNLRKWTLRNSGTPVHSTRRRKSKKMNFQDCWDSCAQNKTLEISKNALPRILGLLCAEQNVGNIPNLAFKNPGTPVRRTQRQNSQKMHFQKLWTLVRRTKCQKYQTCTFILFGLQLAERNVGNLKTSQLCIGSEQSTCPSSQHSTCLASQHASSQQGTCLTS